MHPGSGMQSQRPTAIDQLQDKRMLIMQLTLSIYTASLQNPIVEQKLKIAQATDAALEMYDEVHSRFESDMVAIVTEEKAKQKREFEALRLEYFEESPNNKEMPLRVHLQILRAIGASEQDIPYVAERPITA